MEERLKDLITNIWQSENPSPERQTALTELLILIPQLPGLYNSSDPNYGEAYNLTLEWATKNIQDFKPRYPSWEKSFVTWINGYLIWYIKNLPSDGEE